MHMLDNLLALFDRKTTIYLVAASGVFSLVVIIGLCFDGLWYRPMPVFDVPLLEMRETLRKNPQDQALREEIRHLDQVVRQDFITTRKRLLVGGYLLFFSLLIFVLSLRRWTVLQKKLPEPLLLSQLTEHPQAQMNLFRTLAFFCIPLALLSLYGLSYLKHRPQLVNEAGFQAPQPPGPPLEILVPDNQKWPQLRGPKGSGVVDDPNLPVSWDVEKAENLVWKVEIPGKGHSSPVIWGDRLYITTGDFESRKVLCYQRIDGSLVWSCALRTNAQLDEELKEDEGDTGLAAPTAVTDGHYIVAFFGTNEIAGIDREGRQIWSRWFGPPDSDFGIASSPILSGSTVYLQLDQGSKEKKHSMLYALDIASGKPRWEIPREVPCSWSTPILVESNGRSELITAADPWAISYDPVSGKEIWRAKVLSGAVAPMPASCNGFFFTATEYSQLAAIKTGGQGDITETHVAWTMESDLPDVAGMVTDGKLLILPNGTGKVRCFDVLTGKRIWTQEYDNGFWSNPTLNGDLVYMTDMEGTTFIFKLADKYEEVGQGKFGEPVLTSFAVADSRFYVRGEKYLYCLGKPQ